MSDKPLDLLGKYVFINETELCKVNSLITEPSVVLQTVKEGKCPHCQENIGRQTQVVQIGSSQFTQLKPVPTINPKESDSEQQ